VRWRSPAYRPSHVRWRACRRGSRRFARSSLRVARPRRRFGQGRHARLFARLGHRVVAVDRDAAALAAIAGEAGVETRELDLRRRHDVCRRGFDAIVIITHLHRPLFGRCSARSPPTACLYETRGNEPLATAQSEVSCSRERAPRPRCRRLTVVAFEAGLFGAPGFRAVVQRIAAVGRRRPWPPPLPE
jgi:hypothetical protein